MKLSVEEPINTARTLDDLRFAEVVVALVVSETAIDSKEQDTTKGGQPCPITGSERPAADVLYRLAEGRQFDLRKEPVKAEDLCFQEHNIQFGDQFGTNQPVERTNSGSVAGEAAKLVSGYQTLKSQIEDLKVFFNFLKSGPNVGSAPVRPKPTKSNKTTLRKESSTTRKASAPKRAAEKTNKPTSVSKPVRSVSGKRLGQTPSIRSYLLAKSQLNSSLETLGASVVERLVFKRVPAETVCSIRESAPFKPTQDPRSRPSSSRKATKFSPKTLSTATTAVDGKAAPDSRTPLLNHLMDVLPKAGSSRKRAAEVISLVNVNNLYSSLRRSETGGAVSAAKEAVASFKKTSSPNKSQERSRLDQYKGPQTQARGSCDEFRLSYTSLRVRSKKTLWEEKTSTKDTLRSDQSNLRFKNISDEKQGFARKTDRPSHNPLMLSLKRWDLKCQDAKPVHYRDAETEPAYLRRSANSDSKQLMVRSSLLNSSSKVTVPEKHMPRRAVATNGTPHGKSIPKSASQVMESSDPTHPGKKQIISYLSRNQEDIESNYNALMEWDKSRQRQLQLERKSQMDLAAAIARGAARSEVAESRK